MGSHIDISIISPFYTLKAHTDFENNFQIKFFRYLGVNKRPASNDEGFERR